MQFFYTGNAGIDGAQHQSDFTLLYEGADAETPDAGWGNRKITFLAGFKLRGLLVVHDGSCQLYGVLRCQRLIRHRLHAPIDFESRRKVRRQKKIGTVLADQQFEQVMYKIDSLCAFHKARLLLSGEIFLVLRIIARLTTRHHIAPDQIEQTLIECLHAHILSGLYG